MMDNVDSIIFMHTFSNEFLVCVLHQDFHDDHQSILTFQRIIDLKKNHFHKSVNVKIFLSKRVSLKVYLLQKILLKHSNLKPSFVCDFRGQMQCG